MKKSVLLVMLLVATFAFCTTYNVWFVEFSDESAYREEIANYFQSHTKYDVSKDYGPSLYRDVSQKFIIQAKTGIPDTVEGTLEQMLTYAKAGLLQPLDSWWDTWADKRTYAENAVNALRYKGKLYGIPYNTNVRLLLYRKSIFEKYGLKVPTNWDELVNTAAYITKNVPDMQGFMFTTKSREVRAFQEFMSFYFQLNRHMFNVTDNGVEVVATPEQLTTVLNLYYRMFFEGGIDLNERGADWKALDYGYTSGKYAMITVGPWIWSHRLEDASSAAVLDDTGIVALPVNKNGTSATYMEVKPMMMNTYSKHKDAAWDILTELNSKDFQLLLISKIGVISPRHDVMNEPDMKSNWWLSGFGKYMDLGVALDPVTWDKPQNLIIESIQKTIYKQMTPTQAGQWLYNELVKAAKDM